MRTRTRHPTYPGGIRKRQSLDPLQISIAQAARARGVSRKTLSKSVNERGAVTPGMALRRGQALQTIPELWLHLQRNSDVWREAQKAEGTAPCEACSPASSPVSSSRSPGC